ncbi:MAG TPA: hypothetical protein VFN25_09655 [Dokdonella sp.]|uniref:hypothetical protein n=1 Tax=Dokdonella sp. TaxID=2291710 RepID=UPI002D80D248|nr:hypothetical protein [Dokdonella sp.]HET9033158.1 hypothetical protein [Dokdonella sp.]
MIQPTRIARIRRNRSSLVVWLLAGFLALSATAATAGWQIPAGATVQLSDGHVGLGGTDLVVSGSLALGAGTVEMARAISINPGGVIDAGNGLLELTGTWSNFGSFLAGASTVRFIDGVLAQAGVNGDTLFHDLSFISSSGKTHVLAVGSTQGIDGLLTILGLSGQAIQMASATANQVAYMNLLPTGAQNIHNVGVSDIHAIGQPQAPDETNQGGSGNDLGWFGNTALIEGIPLPVLSPGWLALLGMLLILVVARKRRTQTR